MPKGAIPGELRVVKELSKDQFRDVIRMLKRCPIEQAASVRFATFDALKRLGAKRDPTKAVRGIPSGSDQVNIRRILDWLDKVGPEDRRAIRQLVAIDATAVARSG